MVTVKQVGDTSIRQTHAQAGVADQATYGVPATSAIPVIQKRLLSYEEFGRVYLGSSERKARDVAKLLGLVPVVLGPRCTKLLAVECEAALARLPRQVNASEPSQLLRGKIAKLKAGGGAFSKPGVTG